MWVWDGQWEETVIDFSKYGVCGERTYVYPTPLKPSRK
jgi:hypothetical protein